MSQLQHPSTTTSGHNVRNDGNGTIHYYVTVLYMRCLMFHDFVCTKETTT